MLDIFETRKVEKKICLGDLVGYFHQSIEVLEEMMRSKIPTLLGNHEAYLLGKSSCPSDKWQFISLEYVKNKMSESQRLWLSSLPSSLEEMLDGKRVAYFHGSPWNPLEEYVYPDYPSFDRFSSVAWDYVFLGHTHYPLMKRAGKCMIINPGSCGQPRQGDYRACAAIVDISNNSVEFLNLKYDIKKFLSEARKFGIQERVIHVLERTVK